MKRIVALFLIAALALPAAAQNVAPPRLSSLSDLKADYLEALNSKRFPVHEISVWLVYGDGELTLTGFHPFYTPDSFYSGELVHIVKDFAKAELLSLDKERIRFVGVSNETGHGEVVLV